MYTHEVKYIYLDWNVIQYMKSGFVDDRKFIDGKEFKKIVEELSQKKYLFPFSEGHLRDLSIGYKVEKLDYITEDLNFINKISNGYALGLDSNENLIPIVTDINIFFRNIIKEEEKEVSLKIQKFSSININMKAIQDNDVLRPLLEKNNGVLDSDLINKFIFLMYKNMDNPEYYKKFRLEVWKLKKKFKDTSNTVLNKHSNYYNELVPFLDFLVEDNILNLKNNFKKTMVSFLNIDKTRIFENMKIGEKIELAYSLLDFNPHFRDKINKKNRPSNMYRDIKNLFFASQAKYFITEDKMAYKKAKFVCDILGLQVKVLKMSEFIYKFR